jgi:predicted metal-binding membrane protein
MGLLIALAWLILWTWERSPYGRYLHHGQIGEVDLFAGVGGIMVPAALYLSGWTLMTVAMMLPTTIPLLEIFRRLTALRPDRDRLMGLVIAGYLAAWLSFGIAAHFADWVLHKLVGYIGWLETNGWAISAATLVLAGGFQFSRLKYRCLDKCRAPLSFVTEYWRGRHDQRNAFLLGIHHGIFCVGCCWALMLLMFGVGIGNVGWMLALGALMAIGKNMPWGRRISGPLGLGLACWGSLIFLRHSLGW